MRRVLLLLFIGVVGMGLGFSKIQSFPRLYLEEKSRFMMDTYVTIQAAGPKEVTSQAIGRAFQRMEEVEAKFNVLNPKSPIYAFNHQGILLRDKEILDVIRVALEVSRSSDGAFDITVYPLIKLWRFYGGSPHLPSDKEIKALLEERIGYEHLIFTEEGLKGDRENINIDLGAIAKGYAIGEAAKVLKAEGVTSALIDAGGDIYALGDKGGRPWRVGIQKPRGDGLLGYLEVSDMAVTSSGDYERFFIKGGRRFHHILNPKTGYPVEDVMSVTVIHPSPTLADAWATALFVLGPERGMEIVERIPTMETIMVTTQGEILYSSGLENVFKVLSEAKNRDVFLTKNAKYKLTN